MADLTEKTTQNRVDEDEDLDELDDILSEFSPNPSSSVPKSSGLPPTTNTATEKPGFGRKRTNTRVDQAPRSIPGSGVALSEAGLDPTNQVDEAMLSDEFAKELAKNMEELMKELVTESGDLKSDQQSNESGKDKESETQRVMRAAWEAMLIEGMNGMTGDNEAGQAEGSQKGKEQPGDFQSRIKQTMDKLKESESNLQGGASSENPESLEGLLDTLRDLGLDEDGDDENFNGFLENVMGQLMNKDVLYPPLKELADNYPGYLANPPESLNASDKQRYESQFTLVKKIIAVFEKPDFDDKDTAKSQEILDLMEELQSHGSPPESLMGPMPPGFGLTPDGMPEGCVIG